MESSRVAVRSSGLVTPLGHPTRINGWLQCVVRPSLNEASALEFRLCKVCGARLLLDR